MKKFVAGLIDAILLVSCVAFIDGGSGGGAGVGNNYYTPGKGVEGQGHDGSMYSGGGGAGHLGDDAAVRERPGADCAPSSVLLGDELQFLQQPSEAGGSGDARRTGGKAVKVLHLVPAMEQGGVETVVCDLVRALDGCECVVISKGGRLVDRLVADGGRHIGLDLKSKNPLTAPWRAYRLRCVLRRLSASASSPLVCAHSRVPAWLYELGSRGLGLPYVTFAHGANSVSRYSEVMTRGKLVLCPSQFLADYLKQNYRFDFSRLRVVHPAGDTAKFDPRRLDGT